MQIAQRVTYRIKFPRRYMNPEHKQNQLTYLTRLPQKRQRIRCRQELNVRYAWFGPSRKGLSVALVKRSIAGEVCFHHFFYCWPKRSFINQGSIKGWMSNKESVVSCDSIILSSLIDFLPKKDSRHQSIPGIHWNQFKLLQCQDHPVKQDECTFEVIGY